MNLKRILMDPKTVLVSVAGGFLIGLFAKPVGLALYPVGSLYIAFLSMCLLPILITAIVIGIAGLLRDDNTRPLFKPMAGLYAIGLVLPCVVGIGTAVLLALTKFVIAFYVGGVILMAVYLLVFWLAVRGPIVATLAKLTNPNVLAFMTNNPIVALPSTLDTLERDYGVDRRVPDLVIPFGIFANQHGAVFLLSFLTVFLAQIYVIDLALQDYLVIAIGSIVAGATAVGGGAVLIPTVAPILGAVGLPVSLALVVLATTDNIIGPVRTVLTLQANVTLTVVTARRGKEMPAASPLQPGSRQAEAE